MKYQSFLVIKSSKLRKQRNTSPFSQNLQPLLITSEVIIVTRVEEKLNMERIERDEGLVRTYSEISIIAHVDRHMRAGGREDHDVPWLQ